MKVYINSLQLPFIGIAFLMSLIIFTPQSGFTQASPEEHDSHHPEEPSAPISKKPNPMPAGKSSGGMMGGDMMEKMGEMMSEKGGAKEFYPSLMNMPSLSEEAKAELHIHANERMKLGTSIMNQALIDLTRSTTENNYTAMKDAISRTREGLGLFESGLSTHQSLAQGETPQRIGMNWYKEKLNIENDFADNEFAPRKILGFSWFHLTLMFLLGGFALVMIVMYFLKMKRATELLTKLSAGKEDTAKAGISKQFKGKLRIKQIFSETPTVKTFRFVASDGGDLPFTYQAGQFLNLSVSVDGKPLKRAYTISSHPCHTDALELTIKREEKGLVSRYLHDVVREGDLINVEAAFGNLTVAGISGDQCVVLIGGGVGITPLMSVLRCMVECGMKNEIYLLYACKSLEEFIYQDELKEHIKHHRNLHVVVAVDHLEGEFPGAIQGRIDKDLIAKAVPDLQKSRVHLCGPPPMMKAVRSALAELQVAEEQIKTEAFGAQASPKKSTDQKSTGNSVHFTGPDKSFPIEADQTVLELAEANGINIPATCRVGTCGTCKVKLLSGEVDMQVQDALSPEEKEQGVILACQAKAKNSLEIEGP